MASVAELEASLTAVVDDGAHEIALDVSGVTFLDSLGIGAIVQSAVRQARRRRRLVLVAPSERVRTVLELTGLLTVFTIEERDLP